ncbi:MAG: energy-coupling factor transporter transmembrane protein EcfT [Clostridia bacterium]|nr:energy-coupling factor transporter transmembrane protein EcfT [Clostridia bacterium]
MTDLFSLHPFVALIYFISVFTAIMFSQNPLFSVIALLGGICFSGKSKIHIRPKDFGFGLLVFLAVSMTNPLFSHNGVTVLFFINNNPVTAEAIYYGMYLAVMLLAVLLWFRSFNRVITDDKWLYLTAKISPKLSLLLSTAFRFVPYLQQQVRKIRSAQKAVGIFAGDSWMDKIKSTFNVYSALISFGIEGAVDVGASMKARGYGLKGRSNYSLFRFRLVDFAILCFILWMDIALIVLSVKADIRFVFYPAFLFPKAQASLIQTVIAFLLLCFLPFILSVKEDIKWRFLRSKI